jgi:hypothetical protein
MIEKFFKVTDCGELLEPDWWKTYLDDNGVPKVKKNVVAMQWQHEGKIYSKSLINANSPELLPNGDGVILTEKKCNDDSLYNELVVYESDGSERFRVRPSIVSGRSKLEMAFFYYVRLLADGGWECIFNDGHDDYQAKLDVQTGCLSDFAKTRV